MIVMTPGLIQLVVDAELAGFEIEHREVALVIFKRARRNGVHKLGISIFNDGTAHRTDVRQDLAISIRTQRGMREALGLRPRHWNKK